MPGKPEKKEPEVEIEPSEKQPQQPAQEVELDAVTGKPVEAAKPAEPSVSAEEFRKMQARYEYQARQFERSQRDLQDQLSTLKAHAAPQPVVSPTEKTEGDVYGLSKEELNQLGQSDWTKPVQMMAERIAERKSEEQIKKFFAEQEKTRAEQLKQANVAQTLEREKQWVVEKEPSLNDETSEEFRGFYATYNRLIQEDPTLLQNPRAPRLVYWEWKNSVTADTKSDPEKERLKRVAGGVAPQGRPTSSTKTIKLTQEELDFCNGKGISPAVYASMKQADFKQGVTA